MHRTKESILARLLTVSVVTCALSLTAAAQYGGGTGEPDDPYLIYTAEQMNEIGANYRTDWDKHFKLMANIDMSAYTERSYRIIGTSGNNAFRGVFDGNGKRIWNLTYTATSRSYAGLFGYIKGSKAEVRNLELVDPNMDAGTGACVGSLVGYNQGLVTNCLARNVTISGKSSVGGLIGCAPRLHVVDCSVKGGSVTGDEKVGGLIGDSQVDLWNCHASCRVSGNEEIGGLVGRNGDTITECTARGRVTATGSRAGGLVGSNSGRLADCSARGDVRGRRGSGGPFDRGSGSIGGLVGSNRGLITNCWAGGDVFGEDSIGGLVGSHSDETIDLSYARGTVEGDRSVGGLVGYNRRIATDCYSTGEVIGDDRVGGLVGANTWPAKIINCYCVGPVTGNTDVGGLVGFNDEAVIKTSVWDVQTSGRSNMCGDERLSIGCDNAGGVTTARMQRRTTFTDLGWDFDGEDENGDKDIWSLCEGQSYPELLKQFVLGDFDGNNRVDLFDFAALGERWLSADSRFFWCRGADLTGDLQVGYDDLQRFARNWLADDILNATATVYLSVDDFESYNNLDPSDPQSNRIFDTWADGYLDPATNGAIVGHDSIPFTEQRVVHSGRQSMPYYYDTLFKFARAELTLNPAQNWDVGDSAVLSLWFRGDESNDPAPMCVILNGGPAVYHDDPEATTLEVWTRWNINLSAFAGVDPANVHSVAICFGNPSGAEAGGSGRVFFDDIGLHGPR